ncbi:autotransporter assembly complex protein TamA [Ramlibacter sp.]|uniref:autotransporter assembly complex protein TamA n=1 Tax=Ramlibacter sp. TaxID=1917967 RepID=UPI002C439708|nr:BamA/TamA family outer membrane protein [Ramlibacter sp.]HWI82260.1 BamA/TamA family outer membrane protein [Ramlibacter sp.]
MPVRSLARIRGSLHRLRAAVTAALALGLGAAAWAQEPASPPAGAPAAGPSFELDLRAPASVAPLLRQHMELKRYQEVSDLDDAELARLMVLAERDVRELVGTLGFFDPKISVRREGGSAERPRIVVEVDPGAVAIVAKAAVSFEGEITEQGDSGVAAQREEIRAGWRLPPGHRFTQEAWDGAKTTALRQLVTRRYPAGRISYSLADIDAPAGWANLEVRLDSGPLFRLGPMQVTGISRYDPRLVPRIARLPEGSAYDQERLRDAQLRLAGSGYFDSAFIFVDPQADPKAAPVQVNVREAPLHKVVLGLGLSTDSGPRASVEYLNNRVPGIGWRALTKLQIERKSPFVETEWTAVPDARLWRWGVLARAERVDDGQFITNGQRLRVGRSRAEERIDRSVYAQYDRATVQAQPGVTATPADTGDGAAISANYVWTGRYFDRTPFPARGFGVGFELGGGLTLTGSKSPFQRSVLRWLGIRPLAEGRLQLRAEGGAVLAPARARVPSTQLFRTGGDTTVRGYGYRDIGVALPGGGVGPGRYMALGSVEWQRPIRRDGLATNFESALFVDAGAVSDQLAKLRPWVGVGTGVRWKSPLGPLQVDLAYGVKVRRLRLHFNIGATF